MNVRECAAEMRVSVGYMYLLLKGGQARIPSIHLGRRILVRRETLMKFIADSERINSAA